MAEKSGGKSKRSTAPEGEAETILILRRRVAEAFYGRISKILEAAIAKWEDKVLKDPGYQPSPEHIVGIMKMLRETEEMLFAYSNLGTYLQKGFAELKRLEGLALNLLTEKLPE